jgi:hypothetical protein
VPGLTHDERDAIGAGEIARRGPRGGSNRIEIARERQLVNGAKQSGGVGVGLCQVLRLRETLKLVNFVQTQFAGRSPVPPM